MNQMDKRDIFDVVGIGNTILVVPEYFELYVDEKVKQDNNVIFRDIDKLDEFSDNFFDAVYLFYQIERVDDLDLLFNSVHKILKENGLLFIQSIYYSSIYNTVVPVRRTISEFSIFPWIYIEDDSYLGVLNMTFDKFNIKRSGLFKLESFFLSTVDEWSPQFRTNESVIFAQKHFNNIVEEIIFILRKGN